MKTDARRCLARVRFLRGEFEQTAALCREILELTEGQEPRISRLWAGPLHVESLLALGRGDEARARLDAFAALAGECQSPFFRREAARLEALVAAR